jgi:hypothetical protein
MNENKKSFIADDDRWKKVNAFIEQILSDEDKPMIAPLHPSHSASHENDIHAFLSVINRDRLYTISPNTHSLTERWIREHQQQNWVSALYTRLQALHTKCQSTQLSFNEFFAPLLGVMDSLSNTMQPAPAYRSALAEPKLVFQPRRRDLEPADLPVFNPLFCTAIQETTKPTVLHGVLPTTTYLLTLRCEQKPDWKPELTVVSSAEGTISLDFNQLLQQVGTDAAHVIWFLIEKTNSTSGSWTSGLIWLEPKHVHDAVTKIQALYTEELTHSDTETLLTINQEIVHGRFINAYEKARQALLFQSKQANQEKYIPLRECLWQLVQHIINTMIEKLEESESLFKTSKPDWNAVSSLHQLRNQIRGRE